MRNKSQEVFVFPLLLKYAIEYVTMEDSRDLMWIIKSSKDSSKLSRNLIFYTKLKVSFLITIKKKKVFLESLSKALVEKCCFVKINVGIQQKQQQRDENFCLLLLFSFPHSICIC